MTDPANAQFLWALLNRLTAAEASKDAAALSQLDLMSADLPAWAGRLFTIYRKPLRSDDRERVLHRLAEMAAGAPINSIAAIHGPEGI